MCASPSAGPTCSAELQAEVVVVGGGPAGAACALRLAQLGHEVLLVERAPRGRPHVGESLPASVLPLLGELGVRSAVEAAGFLRPRGAWVQWAGGLQEADHASAGEPGFQVDRGRFDALLLDAARAAGVRMLQPARALAPSVGARGVLLPLHDGRVLRAERVVLAHGRRGAAPGVRTAALYAYWRGMAPANDPRTRVEAGADAWYWGAPLPDGSFNATLFVDAGRCAGLDAAAREALYRALLARSSLLAPCLAGATAAPVAVCDATPRIDAWPITERIVKVGEAAFAIDPLSSQGVQAALRCAWQAAACLHTMVRRPQHASLAIRFYQQQVQHAATRHARLAAGFHAAAAQVHGTPFWRARAAGAAAPRAGAPLPPLHTRVGLDAHARLQPAPTLQGEFVVASPALVHPGLEAPVAFVGTAPVGRLLQALAGPLPVGELLQRWRVVCGEAAAVQLFAAWWAQGVIGVSAG